MVAEECFVFWVGSFPNAIALPKGLITLSRTEIQKEKAVEKNYSRLFRLIANFSYVSWLSHTNSWFRNVCGKIFLFHSSFISVRFQTSFQTSSFWKAEHLPQTGPHLFPAAQGPGRVLHSHSPSRLLKTDFCKLMLLFSIYRFSVLQ